MALSNLGACPPAGTDRTEAIGQGGSGSPRSQPSPRSQDILPMFSTTEKPLHPVSGTARAAQGTRERRRIAAAPRDLTLSPIFTERKDTGEKWDF